MRFSLSIFKITLILVLFVGCKMNKTESVLNSEPKTQNSTNTDPVKRVPTPPIPQPTPAPAEIDPDPVLVPNPTPNPVPNPVPPQNNSSTCQSAKAFYSLHQMPVQNLIGYKNQNTPARAAAGIWFSIPGYTSYSEFKVYIPKGTTYFALTGNQPQSVDYAVVSKFEALPSRTQALSDSEYQFHKSQTNESLQFEKLMAGDEVIFVHNHGGNMGLSGTARLYSSSLAKGGWLYIRVLNGSSIYLLAAVNEVDINVYTQSYNSLSFDPAGDPIDTMCIN